MSKMADKIKKSLLQELQVVWEVLSLGGHLHMICL